MEAIAPQGSVYQAGTLSGNPVAMAAGIATLKQLNQPNFYEDLDRKSDRLATGLLAAAQRAGIKAGTERVGSMLGLFFTDQKVRNFDDAKTSNLESFSKYYTLYLLPTGMKILMLRCRRPRRRLLNWDRRFTIEG
jgi:glutamate-1-semialdehyde 2,1-aminomutase